MPVRITDVREITQPISSPIRNAYIDFSKMTSSLVAVVTNVERDGRRVIGYGFNSNGRYGQGGLIRERFAPRLLEADPRTLLDATGENLDPDRIWACMMTNEKPGGHGDRSVAVGTIDMAVWDAVAKIAGKPLFRLLAERHGIDADPRVFVYAAGGYYYPGKDDAALCAEMRSYLDRGYTVVKMKIGGETHRSRTAAASRRCCRRSAATRSLRSMPTAASTSPPRSTMRRCCAHIRCSGTRSRRSAGLPIAGGAGGVLSGADGNRREPVQPSGCAQPDPLRRHASGPRLAAVRLRAVLRAVRIPADAGDAEGCGMVVAALHPAWRAPDVAGDRRRSGTRRQRELSGCVPALWRLSRTARGWRTAS